MKFRYKPGRSVVGIEPQAVGDELARINQIYGRLKPKILVDESRREDAILHEAFEWDDAIAGEEYRIHQARQIINVVQVIPDQENAKPVQAFINVSVQAESDEDFERAYLPAQVVADDPEMRSAHLATIKTRLKNLRREYAAFSELSNVWSAIDQI